MESLFHRANRKRVKANQKHAALLIEFSESAKRNIDCMVITAAEYGEKQIIIDLRTVGAFSEFTQYSTFLMKKRTLIADDWSVVQAIVDKWLTLQSPIKWRWNSQHELEISWDPGVTLCSEYGIANI